MTNAVQHVYLIESRSLGFLSMAYSQTLSWIGFDAHAYTIEAADAAEALRYAERMAAGRIEWPADVMAIELN